MTDAETDLYSILRVGERGAARHKRRVYDALREGAKDLLVSEDVITSAGGKRVRVRVKLLSTPVFAYDYHDISQVGIGKEGEPSAGDILIDEGEQDGEGEGEGAGSGGKSEYEVEMSIDEVIAMLMEAWQLPNLEAKKRNEIVTEDYDLSDIARKGPRSRVHKKRTMKNALKRAIAGEGEVVIHNDDVRYRAPKPTFSYSSNAVIVLVRDRSGSMGAFEMRCSRMLSVWLVQFLRRRYDSVIIKFVLHDHSAEEVDEHTFYNVRSGGGTEIATAYRFVSELLKQYPESEVNKYVAHFSDGDDYNVASSIGELRAMLPSLQAFFYAEIDQYKSQREGSSEYWQAQHDVEQEYDNFIRYSVGEEGDIAEALRWFLSGHGA